MNRYTKVYNLVKKYNEIYIVRHIGPDPDALASQIALKEMILNTFPNKKVLAIGASVAKFKYFGTLDKVNDINYDSLVISLDIPDIKRVDGVDVTKFKTSIKIDHHPVVDEYANIEIIDADASSTSEIILDMLNNSKFKANKNIAELLFMGIVSDSNRFLFETTTSKTFKLVSKLLSEYKIDTTKLYKKLYARPLSDIRLMGYISTNLEVTKNKLGYILLNEKDFKKLEVDSSSASNMINDFNNINEVLVWMFVTEDEKGEQYKINVRSRGPVINEVCSKYNGGGHKYACGARIKEKNDVDKLIKDLDKLCKEYEEK